MGNADQQSTFSIQLATNRGTAHLDLGSVINFYFIEDIYALCMTGRLQFKDNMGVFDDAQLIGSETIIVTTGEDAESQKEFIFSIIKINRMIPQDLANNHLRNEVDLIFVDPRYHLLNSKYYSKSWTDLKYSDIVKHIGKHHLGIEVWNQFEESQEKIPYFYTGIKTPTQNLRWLMQRCSGSVSKQPGYLLYQNSDYNRWNFTTLEKLLSKEHSEEEKIVAAGQESQHGGEIKMDTTYLFECQNPHYRNKILNHELKMVDHNYTKHLFSGVNLGFDTHRKKLIKQEFTIDEALNRFTILGKYSLFNNNVEGNPDEIIFDLEGEQSETILNNMYYGSWIKDYCQQQTLSIMVRGSHQRVCGKLVEVMWPLAGENFEQNLLMKGKYLIKGITHTFSSADPIYSQRLTLIKNGFFEGKDLLPAKKMNI